MKIVRPVTITDAILTSSDVPETDYAAWSAATAYTIGDRVIRTTTHRIYERLVSGTTATEPENDTTNWLDIGPTNRWAMFDATISTATSQSTSIEVVLTPGRIGAIALLDVSATNVTVEMETVADGVIYSETVAMSERDAPVSSWYTYFFTGFEERATLVLTDLPIAGSATVTVTIDGGTGTASIGTLVVGMVSEIGGVEYGVRAGIQDYSRKDTDSFGRTTFVQRSFAKTFEGRLFVESSAMDALYRFLAGIRATPVLWIGADDIETLTLFGFYRDFSIDVAYPTVSYCSLTIEGLA